MSLKRLEAVVHGRVQNVGFREFVRAAAAGRSLVGYARNSDDGRSVEVVAEGGDEALAELLKLLGQGPRLARVDRIESAFSEPTTAFSRFTIER